MKVWPESCVYEDSYISKHAWSSCGLGSPGQLCKCWLAARLGGGAPESVWAPAGRALENQHYLPSAHGSLALLHRLSPEQRGLQGDSGCCFTGVQVTNPHVAW